MRYLVLAMIFMLPLAQAGSPDAPEIADATGDGFAQDPESARDIEAGWVEYIEGVFRFNALLADDPTHAFASVNAGSEVIRFGFTPDTLELEDQEAYVRIRFGASTGTGNAGEEIVTCRFGIAAEDEYEDILTQVDLTAGFDGRHFWCDMPEAQIGYSAGNATTLSKLHMDAHFIQRGPLSGDLCLVVCAPGSGGDLGGVNEVAHYDRAPDEGYGLDFVIAQADAAINTTGNVTGNATDVVGNATAPDAPTPEAPAGNETLCDDCQQNLTAAPSDDKESPGPALAVLMASMVALARRRK